MELLASLAMLFPGAGPHRTVAEHTDMLSSSSLRTSSPLQQAHGVLDQLEVRCGNDKDGLEKYKVHLQARLMLRHMHYMPHLTSAWKLRGEQWLRVRR